MTGTSKPMLNQMKSTQPRDIVKANEKVSKLKNAMLSYFLNPFDCELQKDKLYHLVSASSVDESIAISLLSTTENGENMKNDFEKRLFGDSESDFFSPIKKFKVHHYQTGSKVTVRKGKQEKQIASHRGILGRLLTVTHKMKAAVNLEKAITYPLSSFPPSLTFPDGSPRKSVKSKLFDAALSNLSTVNTNELPCKQNLHVYFIDLIAMIRVLPKANETIRSFTWKLLNTVPKQYDTIFFVCDSYKANSIKAVERDSRGSAAKYLLSKPDMKLPSDFATFMKNGENKTKFLQLIQQAIDEEKQQLGNRIVYFSGEYHCQKICSSQSTLLPALQSDHEEADTKLVALVTSYFDSITDDVSEQSVMVRSPSGDIDILALFVLHCSGSNIFIDNGHGNSRKIFHFKTPTLSILQRQALSGVHAFSGNDYISSFFGKGKNLFWKAVTKNNEFMSTFASLGNTYQMSSQTEKQLERFVCSLYGFKTLSSVNEVRKCTFLQKYSNNCSRLNPPCEQNLQQHIKRANYIAAMNKRANLLIMSLEEPTQHGWDENIKPEWHNVIFPDDISELLFDNDDRDTSDDDSFIDSSSDENSDYSETE